MQGNQGLIELDRQDRHDRQKNEFFGLAILFLSNILVGRPKFLMKGAIFFRDFGGGINGAGGLAWGLAILVGGSGGRAGVNVVSGLPFLFCPASCLNGASFNDQLLA